MRPKKQVTIAGRSDQEQPAPAVEKSVRKPGGPKPGKDKQQSYKAQLEELIRELESTRAENESLRRSQARMYGMSVESIDKLKSDYERVKTANAWLLQDIEARKEKCSQMEQQTFELNMKMEGQLKKMNDMTKERKQWMAEKEKMGNLLGRIQRLEDDKKKLQKMLSANGIDLTTGQKIGVGKKPLKSILRKNNPAQGEEGPKFNLGSQSMEDLRKSETEQTTPAYYGYYTDIHRKNMAKIRPPVPKKSPITVIK